MTTRKLLWGMTWQGVVWGTLLGTMGGAFYIIVATALSSSAPSGVDKSFWGFLAIEGMIAGGTVGLPLGLGMGLLLAFLYSFFPFDRVCLNRFITGITSAILATVDGWIGFRFYVEANAALYGSGGRPVEDSELLWFATVPALIAGVCAVFVSQHLAHWYERESAKGIAQNASSS